MWIFDTQGGASYFRFVRGLTTFAPSLLTAKVLLILAGLWPTFIVYLLSFCVASVQFYADKDVTSSEDRSSRLAQVNISVKFPGDW